MPIYTRIITSLSDFIILIDEILTKYGASVFVEDKTNDGFINKLVITDNTTRLVKSNRDKNLNFFITTHYCPVKAGKSVFEIVET